MINPNLNRKRLKQQFARDDRIKIENFLEPDVMQLVASEIVDAPFELVYVLDGKMQTTSSEKMASMSAEKKKQINQLIVAQASDGIGFLYGSCHLGVSRPAGIGAEMVKLFEFWRGEEMMEFVRSVTGDTMVNDVSGHYTRFVPGQFLTRHRDVVLEESRRFAYVLSFTEKWHPDWGGLLQYYEEDGTPRDSWAAQFNSLTIFAVRHIHAVTYVTPFARGPRLSLTGWFNAAPVQ